jgi:hypothetical protein
MWLHIQTKSWHQGLWNKSDSSVWGDSEKIWQVRHSHTSSCTNVTMTVYTVWTLNSALCGWTWLVVWVPHTHAHRGTVNRVPLASIFWYHVGTHTLEVTPKPWNSTTHMHAHARTRTHTERKEAHCETEIQKIQRPSTSKKNNLREPRSIAKNGILGTGVIW